MAVERVYQVRCDNPACGSTATPADTREQAQANGRAEGIVWHLVPRAKGPMQKRYRCSVCLAAVKARNDAVTGERS